MPSEVAKQDASDFSLNLLVARIGITEENKQYEKMNKKNKVRSR